MIKIDHRLTVTSKTNVDNALECSRNTLTTVLYYSFATTECWEETIAPYHNYTITGARFLNFDPIHPPIRFTRGYLTASYLIVCWVMVRTYSPYCAPLPHSGFKTKFVHSREINHINLKNKAYKKSNKYYYLTIYLVENNWIRIVGLPPYFLRIQNNKN